MYCSEPKGENRQLYLRFLSIILGPLFMYLFFFLFHVEYPLSCNERIKFAGISLYRLFICWEFLSLSRRLEN